MKISNLEFFPYLKGGKVCFEKSMICKNNAFSAEWVVNGEQA